MKIIFLDIDGVLNCQDAYQNGECKYEDIGFNNKKDFYMKFYSLSKFWLNKLIEETDAKIVISSTWRMQGIEWLQKIWELEGMSGEIIDITPLFRNQMPDYNYTIPRGCEIDYYLKSCGFYNIFWSEEEQQKYIDKSGIENYIIIDDDSDMLYQQKEHFIPVLPPPRNTKGFSKEHYLKSKEILSKSVIDIQFRR